MDSSGGVYVVTASEGKGEPNIYDNNLKYLRKGWGKYGDIVKPEKSDSLGNNYGFGVSKEYRRNLLKYNSQSNACYALPITRDRLEWESWAVSNEGNIYFTKSSGDSFKVIKLSSTARK